MLKTIAEANHQFVVLFRTVTSAEVLLRGLKAVAFAFILALAACSTPEQRVEAHYKSGMEFLEKGDFAKAAIEFRSALQINEDHADSWFGLAQVEEHNQAWPRVTGNLKRVIEINPNHVKARVSLGKLMLLGGNVQEALTQVNAAAALEP